MTTLEIILLAIIWIGYGLLNFLQSGDYNSKDYKLGFILHIIGSPIVLIVRLFLGIFSYKFWENE